MAAKGSFPPIEEQFKNANTLMGFADQPVVVDLILRLAEQHTRAKNGAHGEANAHTQGTTLTQSVRKILPFLPVGFTYKSVIRRLSEDGYEFQATERRTAVNRVLRKLLDEGVIKELTRGTGGTPSTYQLT